MHLEEQSPDIGQGVHGLGTKTLEEIGAGDQGHMFGYATDETEELMPLTHVLATRIGYKLTEVRSSLLLALLLAAMQPYSSRMETLHGMVPQCSSPSCSTGRVPVTGAGHLDRALLCLRVTYADACPVLKLSMLGIHRQLIVCSPQLLDGETEHAQVRKDGSVPWLRPDGKTQVTIEYKKDGGAMIPIRVHTILISTQHSPDVTNDKIHADLMEHVIKPVVPSKYLDDKTIFHLNPSGASLLPLYPLYCRWSAFLST